VFLVDLCEEIMILSNGTVDIMSDYHVVIPVLLSLGMCFGLAPLLAVLLGRLFSLPDDIVAGIGLVGAINGAQSSNICAYIMDGDVALSVLLTVASTVSGVLFTPLLCRVLLQSVVNVDPSNVIRSIATTVMVPITLGLILKGCVKVYSS
jgi:BASS family bile acid:Na+ symporter